MVSCKLGETKNVVSCIKDSVINVDGVTLIYLIMIFLNIAFLVFIALTTESFENMIQTKKASYYNK